jgi:transposase
MTPKRTHFPRTTAAQRRLLFETWEATGNREDACRTAHVGQRSFYNWKGRFETEGYDGLNDFRSHAPKKTRRVAPEIETLVKTMREQHPNWGKQRIADELAKDNNWAPLVSPNTVRRILQDAGLWPEPEEPAKKGGLRP